MFHVFVEGAKDASPGGLQRLAQAIATHYGLPAADLQSRLAGGRFRVKGNVDRATAERYVQDLDRLGARTTIERAAGPTTTPPVGLPQAPARPTPTPTGAPGAKQYQSGLSAAFSSDTPAASLGALEKADAAFSLASVDGRDTPDAKPVASAFAPPAPQREPARAPRLSLPNLAPAAQDEPADQFAPPGSADDLRVELAPEDEPPPRRPSLPRATTPEPPAPVTPSSATPAPIPARPTSGHLLADERVRFIAGIVLAILIGFVPAHFVASVREHSVYAAADRQVIAAQQLADNPDDYAKLDAVRAEQLQKKKDERFSIALLALAIWGVAGGAVAYGWFRKMPWERITGVG